MGAFFYTDFYTNKTGNEYLPAIRGLSLVFISRLRTPSDSAAARPYKAPLRQNNSVGATAFFFFFFPRQST